MFCPKCAEKIDNNSKFCPYCGFKITKTCKNDTKNFVYCKDCGQKNDVNENFCTNCMNRLNKNEHESEYSAPRNGVGFALGLFFGLIGLIIGLCLYPFGSISRKTFINSWSMGFFVWLCISIIIVLSCVFAIPR